MGAILKDQEEQRKLRIARAKRREQEREGQPEAEKAEKLANELGRKQPLVNQKKNNPVKQDQNDEQQDELVDKPVANQQKSLSALFSQLPTWVKGLLVLGAIAAVASFLATGFGAAAIGAAILGYIGFSIATGGIAGIVATISAYTLQIGLFALGPLLLVSSLRKIASVVGKAATAIKNFVLSFIKQDGDTPEAVKHNALVDAKREKWSQYIGILLFGVGIALFAIPGVGEVAATAVVVVGMFVLAAPYIHKLLNYLSDMFDKWFPDENPEPQAVDEDLGKEGVKLDPQRQQRQQQRQAVLAKLSPEKALEKSCKEIIQRVPANGLDQQTINTIAANISSAAQQGAINPRTDIPADEIVGNQHNGNDITPQYGAWYATWKAATAMCAKPQYNNLPDNVQQQIINELCAEAWRKYENYQPPVLAAEPVGQQEQEAGYAVPNRAVQGQQHPAVIAAQRAQQVQHAADNIEEGLDADQPGAQPEEERREEENLIYL